MSDILPAEAADLLNPTKSQEPLAVREPSHADRPPRIVVFDVELARSPDEFPDSWAAALRGDCGMSCAVAYDSEKARPYIYDAYMIYGLCDHLEMADLLVSFNGISFDLRVIEAVAGRHLDLREHFDIKREITRKAGVRKGWKLGEVSQRTLGRGKSGEGALAPSLFRSGKWGELVSYCLDDVYLTRDLYNHIVMAGSVVGPKGELVDVGGWTSDLA